MKTPILLFLSSFFANSLLAQEKPAGIDSALAAKITVSGFCLCHTTIDDLVRLDKNLAEVTVEEMDLGKKCIATDGRYINGKGYYSDSVRGMIFQKDDGSDYISKIRLTKRFRGKLPNGTFVDLSNMKLKDVFNIYPGFKDKWGSRDCSDFWSFSNDTIAFYVRIDSTKKPQYPVDEAYYLDRPVDGIDLVISCYGIFNQGNTVSLFDPSEPAYFLDSIRTNSGFLKTSGISPSEIAFINVIKGSKAIARAGKDGANGAVDIITKSFARQHYWDYFTSKSDEYRNQISNLKTEAEVVYILNDKVISKDQEATLFPINNDSFISLKVVDGDFLEKEYKLHGKSIGVVIKAKLKK